MLRLAVLVDGRRRLLLVIGMTFLEWPLERLALDRLSGGLLIRTDLDKERLDDFLLGEALLRAILYPS